MANQSSLKKQYYQQRKRIERYYRKYEQQGYERTDKALPPIPKKITEASVRRLKSYTPEKMQKNLISPFYYSEYDINKPVKKYQEKTLYEEKHRTNFSDTFQKEFRVSYPQIISDRVREKVYELKPPKFDYEYYRQVQYEADYESELRERFYHYADEDKTSWTKADYDYASDDMAYNYKDMSDNELSMMDLMRTDDGYIMSTNTGEIIARDMSAQKKEVDDFAKELDELEGYEPVDFSWEDLVSGNYTPDTEEPKQEQKTSFDADETTINIFLYNCAKFPKMAYPYIKGIVNSLAARTEELTTRALAMAIEKLVNEYGHMTREIAYNNEKLTQYGSALESYFALSVSELESLNAGLEEDESVFSE